MVKSICILCLSICIKHGTKEKEIEDFQAFYDKLWSVVTRSKYMVHHVFRKGDLLFMDQLLTSHRRSMSKTKTDSYGELHLIIVKQLLTINQKYTNEHSRSII